MGNFFTLILTGHKCGKTHHFHTGNEVEDQKAL